MAENWFYGLVLIDPPIAHVPLLCFRQSWMLGFERSGSVARNFAAMCGHAVLWSADCCGYGILQPFRRPAAIEIGPLVTSKHYDLQSLGCAIQNSLHLLKSPIVGVDASLIE